jgi:Trypsin
VYLTAAHCTAFLESEGIAQVWVTFAPAYDEDATSLSGLFAGTYVTHPEFGSGGASDTHDIAVVLLERSPGITPAVLPAAGLLDRLKASHQLRDRTFTAVGYGTVREDKTGGPHAFFFDGIRRYALQSALNLEQAWLLLFMNPSTGSGGGCFGDSGGPHFLGGVRSNLLVSITITGDAMCRAPTRPTGWTPRAPGTSSTSSSCSPSRAAAPSVPASAAGGHAVDCPYRDPRCRGKRCGHGHRRPSAAAVFPAGGSAGAPAGRGGEPASGVVSSYRTS